jgi:hypothetical protein
MIRKKLVYVDVILKKYLNELQFFSLSFKKFKAVNKEIEILLLFPRKNVPSYTKHMFTCIFRRYNSNVLVNDVSLFLFKQFKI